MLKMSVRARNMQIYDEMAHGGLAIQGAGVKRYCAKYKRGQRDKHGKLIHRCAKYEANPKGKAVYAHRVNGHDVELVYVPAKKATKARPKKAEVMEYVVAVPKVSKAKALAKSAPEKRKPSKWNEFTKQVRKKHPDLSVSQAAKVASPYYQSGISLSQFKKEYK